ncbi:MAG TPA: multidrug resistance protein [Armatimonadetes bacterium]|nr:multidrug resistance protein [Armatimonadota bacterium]
MEPQGRPIVLILVAVSLGAFGQILIKYGMSEFGEISGVDFGKAVRALFTPYVFSGVALYVISTLFWLIVLSRAPLSFAYPMIAAGYVLVVFLSWLVLGERVTALRMAGLALIVVGVALVGRT